jgi:hypothetical protein
MTGTLEDQSLTDAYAALEFDDLHGERRMAIQKGGIATGCSLSNASCAARALALYGQLVKRDGGRRATAAAETAARGGSSR